MDGGGGCTTFNRTNMELKYGQVGNIVLTANAFNRTNMELK